VVHIALEYITSSTRAKKKKKLSIADNRNHNVAANKLGNHKFVQQFGVQLIQGLMHDIRLQMCHQNNGMHH